MSKILVVYKRKKKSSVLDPEYEAFFCPLDPGSGIGFFQISDFGSQTLIFESGGGERGGEPLRRLAGR
jgi:hypothetical protein